MNRRNHELARRNPPAAVWRADDKLATKAALAAARVPVPATLAVIDSTVALRRVRPVDLPDEFVAKPSVGSGGSGILVVAGRAGERTWRSPSRRTVEWAAIRLHLADLLHSGASRSAVAFLEERLDASLAFGGWAAAGLPDVRVVCVDGEPRLAMLRLPTRASGGRANLHAGGIGAGVDLADGRIAHAVAGRRPVSDHPDTGARLLGRRVPGWDDLLDVAVRAARASELGLTGVDVAVDDRLGPVVLEVNARPGLTIQLANRAVLRW